MTTAAATATTALVLEPGEELHRPARLPQDLTQLPPHWLHDADYEPEAHTMNLKGRTYLLVAQRLRWFVAVQRLMIYRGLAVTTYCIETVCVEHDRVTGFAHFKTTIRDVLGNEAVMYGSETSDDFGDYAEKASTKSLGRALIALGYGTPEDVLEEPERPERHAPRQRQQETETVETRTASRSPSMPHAPASRPAAPDANGPLNGGQRNAIHNLCTRLEEREPAGVEQWTYTQAANWIREASARTGAAAAARPN